MFDEYIEELDKLVMDDEMKERILNNISEGKFKKKEINLLSGVKFKTFLIAAAVFICIFSCADYVERWNVIKDVNKIRLQPFNEIAQLEPKIKKSLKNDELDNYYDSEKNINEDKKTKEKINEVKNQDKVISSDKEEVSETEKPDYPPVLSSVGLKSFDSLKEAEEEAGFNTNLKEEVSDIGISTISIYKNKINIIYEWNGIKALLLVSREGDEENYSYRYSENVEKNGLNIELKGDSEEKVMRAKWQKNSLDYSLEFTNEATKEEIMKFINKINN